MEAGEKGKAHEEPNTVTMEAGDFDENQNISMEAGEHGLRLRGVDENGKKRTGSGLIKTLVFESPNGTRYWKPDVISDEKPTVGMVFQTWDDAYNFYNSYVELSGFSTRIGPSKKWNGDITHRYVMCSKAGKPKCQKFETIDLEK
ncbi:hypothetical protein E3N88_23777 [Mikania micrantha]|uniref:FAR1 domain-containing protein n=1 Tax=Mikania micrantha TaxID=192012 RepID=A0A5N6NE79_9ASTR|nr:hypothetical protein E3N88_23777 [Mikania micrantha]